MTLDLAARSSRTRRWTSSLRRVCLPAVAVAACFVIQSQVLAQATSDHDTDRSTVAANIVAADGESAQAQAADPGQTQQASAPASQPASQDSADKDKAADSSSTGSAAPAAQQQAPAQPELTPAESEKPQEAKPGVSDIQPVRTRWRTYDLEGHPEYGYKIYDAYHQNPIKGDYPLGNSNWFAEVDALDTTVYKSRRNVDFSNRFAPQIAAGKISFFDLNNFFNENAIFGTEFRHNDDRFVPSNFRIRFDGVADLKHDINAFNNTTDSNGHLFDAFFDLQVHDFGHDNFDQMFVRGGIQFFKSDFHGLIFNDEGLGGRMFGAFDKNRFRYDLVGLKLFQKDAVSGFVDFTKPSAHTVGIVRFTAEDFLFKGWNSEWSFHYNHDPRKILGGPGELGLDTVYFGTTLNGHIGRIIFNPAFYAVTGHADHGGAIPLLGGTVVLPPVEHSVGAYMGLVDIEYPLDNWRFRAGYVYTSGDNKPFDKHDSGFDSISDAVTLFGGPISYFIGSNIKFGNGDFIRPNSFYSSFRGINNQANYVNPGIQVINAGVDTIFTRRVQFSGNLNYYLFNELGAFPNNNKFGVPVIISHHDGGFEQNVFLRFKPFLRKLNDLVLIDTGFSVMQPLQGMKDAFGSSRPVYSTFLALRLVY